ncbi:MAG: hypothetical protein EBY29_17505, partial [Planctomycetes bacterium]|nr:hypothetical protein [Planctomycetota bacterium]
MIGRQRIISEAIVFFIWATLVSRAVLKETRTTPQKARRVVNIIRGVRADNALTTLKFANQEIAGELYTLLASAVANAK